MIRVLGVAVIVAGLTSCTFGAKQCVDNTDCAPTGMCSGGFCYALDSGTGGSVGGGGGTGGGGTGGGVGGGGGGTTTGGGGGSMGGGAGGGAAQANCDNTDCADFDVCVPDLDGGQCVRRGLIITWVTPAQNPAFVREATVPAAFSVTEADGGPVTFTDVPVTNVSTGFGVGGGGLFVGTLDLTAGDQQYEFIAGWPDAGVSSTLTITRDNVAPQVTVQVESRPASAGDPDPVDAGYWKKDEIATVRVTVDGGRPAVLTDISPRWGGTVSDATCAGCTGACSCFGIDLAGSNVPGMRGEDSILVAPISDLAGNTSSAQDAGIKISRFKFARSMNLLSSGTPVLPVGVSRDGVVVWGAEESAIVPVLTPRLYATGQDGGSLWNFLTAKRITAGPVASSSSFWIATDDLSESEFVPFDRLTGASGSPRCSGTLSGPHFTGDLALATVDGGDVPIGIRAGEISPGFGATSCPTNPNGLPTSGGRPTVIVQVDGGSVDFFTASTAAETLWKTRLESGAYSQSGSATLVSFTQVRGLFSDSSKWVGGGGTASVFLAPSNGPIATVASTSTQNSGPQAVGTGFVLYGTSNGRVAKVNYDSLSGAMTDGGVTLVNAASSFQDRTPLLGDNGVAYVIADDGKLFALRQSDLSQIWVADFASGSVTQVSQPALDVYRTSTRTKDCAKPIGVLYVTTKTGTVATLRATIVDSRGLDGTAPWPKYQRDNGNTGNASASLEPWSCPP